MTVWEGADTQTELVLRNCRDVDATDENGPLVFQEVEDGEDSRAFAAVICGY